MYDAQQLLHCHAILMLSTFVKQGIADTVTVAHIGWSLTAGMQHMQLHALYTVLQ